MNSSSMPEENPEKTRADLRAERTQARRQRIGRRAAAIATATVVAAGGGFAAGVIYQEHRSPVGAPSPSASFEHSTSLSSEQEQLLQNTAKQQQQLLSEQLTAEADNPDSTTAVHADVVLGTFTVERAGGDRSVYHALLLLSTPDVTDPKLANSYVGVPRATTDGSVAVDMLGVGTENPDGSSVDFKPLDQENMFLSEAYIDARFINESLSVTAFDMTYEGDYDNGGSYEVGVDVAGQPSPEVV